MIYTLMRGLTLYTQAKVRSCEGEEAILLSHFRLRNFALSHLRSKGKSANVEVAHRNTIQIRYFLLAYLLDLLQ